MYSIYIVNRNQFSRIFNLLEINSYDKVLLKPNICGFYPPDINMLKTLLQYLVDHVNQILIGDTDSTLHRVETRFYELKLHDLAKDFGGKVLLKNLLSYGKIDVSIPNPRAVKKIPIPTILFNIDYFINIAKIGSHPSTKITAALKNLFGIVAVKGKYFRYHPRGMDKVISDIAKIVKPNLNIVEVNDKILISKDILAIDIVASKMFGIDPFKVKHLVYVAKDRGISLKEIINKIKIIKI